MLTEEERHKFATYCRAASLSAKRIAEEMAKLGDRGPMALLASAEKQKSVAYAIVANDLSAAEGQAVRKVESGTPPAL